MDNTDNIDNDGMGAEVIKHRQRPTRNTEEEIRIAILSASGILVRAARALGVGNTTIYKYIEMYNLKDFVKDARERVEDLALAVVIDNMENDPKLALGLLNYLGRYKGHTTPLGGMTINVTSVQQEDDLNIFIDERE